MVGMSGELIMVPFSVLITRTFSVLITRTKLTQSKEVKPEVSYRSITKLN